MDLSDGGPLVRGWTMTGEVIGVAGVAENFCRAARSELTEAIGCQGGFVLVDRGRGILRGLSLWTSHEALERSWPTIEVAAAATVGQSQVVLDGPHVLELAYARLHSPSGRARLLEVEPSLARVTVLEGGSVATPAVVEDLVAYSRSVSDLPGCQAALLLCAPERHQVIGVTFWADQRSVDRTDAVADRTSHAVPIATGSTLRDAATYDVLVAEHR